MTITQIAQCGLSLRESFPNAAFVDADDIRVSSCCSDPRACHPGDVFVAMVGDEDDGHDAVADAVARGAVAVVAERMLPMSGVPMCLVPDSRVAYGQICHVLAGHPSRDVKVIGVTGTHGKTSVSCLIAAMLESSGMPVGLMNSMGYCDGRDFEPALWDAPPAAVLAHWLARMRDNGCSHAVVEVPSAALAAAQFSGVEFDTACLLNIRREHLGKHGSLTAYRAVKERFFAHLTAGGMAVVGVDDPVCAGLLERVNAPTLTASLFGEAEVSATVVDRCRSEQTLLLTAGSETIPLRTAIIGDPHAQNCLIAAAVGLAQGLDLAAIVRGLESVKRLPGRLERIECGQPFGVFVDEARTAGRLVTALETLRGVTDGRLISVVEAGGRRAAREREYAEAAERFTDVVVATTAAHGSSRLVQQNFVAAFQNPETVRLVADRDLAIRWALNEARAGDCVLIAGSRRDLGRALPAIVENDDRDTARQWLYDQGVLLQPIARKHAA